MTLVMFPFVTFLASCLFIHVQAACTPNTTSTDDLQTLLTNGGQGYILSLCANQIYSINKILNYTAAEQEISTEGYPTDESRATLLISGFNMTTAVRAIDANLTQVKLRNIQINGNRGDSDIYQSPGANIEFGGENQGQLIEYVRSFDPRGWSCMHIAEGPFKCSGVTIQNNDIGPCGSEQFQEWADGISLSCQSSLVQNNYIVDATDGGIVIFGSPNSTIRNNTIHVKTRTLLGGINMVDPVPWPPMGNFSHVVVENNTIMGGYATGYGNETYGTNNASAMIKIGLAIGPRVWFSDDRYGKNQSTGAIVRNNLFSGAFSFAIGLSSAKDFTIQNNSFFGNVSFFGDYGPNCTSSSLTPHPPTALLYEPSTLTNVTISLASIPSSISSLHNDTTFFQSGTTNGLTCFIPPSNTTHIWPYGDGFNINEGSTGTSTSSGGGGASSSRPATSSHGAAPSKAILDYRPLILGSIFLGSAFMGSLWVI